MHIKSIVLDGFKSYGNRVEVTGFDPEFNAITGLNGTGKSNILDSICFVLGITNLSNVRAGSLQELIYKHGQAGITKATVSITFDNRDKKQCPIGYENHDEITVTRQVVMGGKNKYLINGINVQNKRVSDLFCSVQLNVNNPHFLIMQGRITKVLNMKPPEILSMVEEAAGTRMYEAKKQAAQKTIEKKDAKLRELNDIIKEDIAPKLQKLQDERSQFQEYQKVVRELENLTRLHVAWKYVTAEENTKKAEAKVTEVQDDIKSKKENIKNNEKEAKELDKKVAEMNKKLDEESGNALKELEAELGEREKAEAGSGAAAAAARDADAAHTRRARLLQRALHDDEAALHARRAALHQVSSTFEGLRTANEASEAALSEAQAKFLAVSTGLEGGSESLQDQLMAAKAEASEASTRISQSTMEKKHAEERLKTLEREFKSSSSQFQRDQDAIGRHQAQVEQLKSELSGMQFSSERNAQLRENSRSLQSRVRAARDRSEGLSARLQRCHFQYTPPQRDFDTRRVLGTICRLIDVRDPKYCTALETAAGGRLYNVVVDTEVTSKLLLQRGNLQTRTTIIPLNKISGHVIDADTVRLAQEIGGGADSVQLALDLVSFPPRAAAALRWVLGGALVCRDLETARRVTFHPRVRRRCVTLDGDVCDPSGTLSGGARIKGGSVLLQLQELKQQEQELQEMEEELARCNAELESMQHAAEKYSSTQQKYEMMSHELEVIKARLATTSHAQTHAEIESLRQQVAELSAAVERDKATQKEAAARARELELKVKDIKGHREREFKKAEEALKKAKKDAEQHSSSWKLREQEFETLRLEVAELEQAVVGSQQSLKENKEAAAVLQKTLHDAKTEHEKATEAVKDMQARIKKQKAEIAGRSSDIARLLHKKEQLGKLSGELELAIKELEYKIKELQTEAADCEKRMRSLESEHAWIPGERQYFGAAGGLYDFAARGAGGAGAAAQRLQQLRERRDRLARGLNARAHTLLAKEEEQYQDVMRKKKIVEADRAKLVQVMAELDEKKKRTLVGACEQVNRDFGAIFSALLPGAQAQLRPPPGRGVLDGLEVKVGFNKTWKESLGELSGGQRSLVALSLVLAMLLFKPAPLYILDEVDAALDLSHTQNIGQMLKEHFKHSQFIIVSLKDGMFNNANVLFRTKFVDGMSSVQRTVNTRR
ncbi:structural maintenance of chromosomes 2 [Aphomia sociella]